MEGVRALAASLQIGLASVVFLGGAPRERARVREMLPEVLVPELPEDPLLRPGAVEALRCFDAPFLSHEDLVRTHLYAEERRRGEERHRLGSLGAGSPRSASARASSGCGPRAWAARRSC